MTPPPSRRYELGVLFVHGIGQSRRGDTLIRSGGALARFLERWLEGARRGASAVLERARLEPPADDPDAPAHGELVLAGIASCRKGPPRHGAPEESRWLLAESWWAEAFPTPSFGQLARWAFVAFPWTLLSHFDRRLRRALYEVGRAKLPEQRLRWLARTAWEAVAVGVALLALPLVLAFMVALVIVGLLPIPALRSGVQSVQRWMAAYIGDSLVLLDNPVTREAILDRVRRDLEWLGLRCDRVAVVAHSQGGAIAHMVARSKAAGRCHQLVTFGSGLQKLAELDRARKVGAGPDLGLASICAAVVAFCGVAIVRDLLGGQESFPTLVLCFGAIALLGGAFFVQRWRGKAGKSANLQRQYQLDRARYERDFRLPSSTRWDDVYAWADPVPNGALLDSDLPDAIVSYEIHSRGSLLLDHTAYWTNLEHFVGPLAMRLGSTAGIELNELQAAPPGATGGGAPARGLDDASYLELARLRRWLRARTGTATRRLLVALLASLPVAHLLDLLDLRSAAHLGDAGRLLAGVPKLPGLLARFAGAAPLDLLYPAAAWLGIVSLVWLGATVARSVWEWQEQRAFLRREEFRPLEWPYGVWVGGSAGIALAFGLDAFPAVPAALAGCGALALTLLLAFAASSGVPFPTSARAAAGPARRALDRAERRWIARLRRALAAGDPRAALPLARSSPEAEKDAILRRGMDLGSPNAAYILGSRGERDGRLPEAEAAFERALRLGDFYAGYRLGQLRQRRGDPTGALEAFEASARAGSSLAVYAMAELHLKSGQEREAREAYAWGMDLRESLCADQLGHLAEKAGDLETAEACYGAGARWGSGLSAQRLGELLRQQGRLEEAREALRTALALGHADGGRLLGQLLEEEGDREGALAAYQWGMELGSWSAAQHLGMLVEAELSDLGTRPLPESRLFLALRAFRFGAEQGDAAAALRLGELLERFHPLYTPWFAEGAAPLARSPRAAFERAAELFDEYAAQRVQDGDLPGADAARQQASDARQRAVEARA